MGYKFRIVITIIIGFTLLGCVKKQSRIVKPSPDKALIEAMEIAKYNDLQLCKITDSFYITKLNVNPSSHPEYNDNLRHFKILQSVISARGLNCYKIKDEAKAKQSAPLNTREKEMRVSSVCQIHARRSQFADPNVLLEMCVMGYRSTQEKCTSNITKFNNEAQKMAGNTRAEYIEIGSAFRMGCNLK
ncbi:MULTISPECIES: hypothetical protein [Morganellaceae]|uniref:Lipoprotein n=1 Tax=Moellerella wisconsensis TaxID=158849 RepID=A0A9Q8Q5Q7_9GAMM|nr:MULTISPECIES: hypothetical protein [Morganellaceae]QCJ72102.1 hypothetical protein C9446_20025 [Providencia heimbachae]UNH32461.1 hypothetical protein MNY72_17200 [Moellerella wisconsensis]WJW83581.1 hypothetical protein QU516_15260 [Moellerella wisconsensis]